MVSRLVYSCHETVWSVDLYTLVTRRCGQSTCILLSRDGVVSTCICLQYETVSVIHLDTVHCHETVWSVDSTCILLSRDGVVSRLVYSCHETVWSVDLYTLVTRRCGQSTCILLSRDGVVSRLVYSCHEMVWSVDLYTLVTRWCGQSICILLSRDGVVSRLVYSCHETVWSVDLYTLVLPLLSYHGWVNKNLSAKLIVSSIIFTG